jgi:aspartate racemase
MNHSLAQTVRDESIPKRSISGALPVSFAQEQIWYLDQLEPYSPLYNIAEGLRLRGHLDEAALEKSLNLIIARHEALRTNFLVEDGSPAQVVGDQRELRVEFTDLSTVPTPRQADLLQFLGDREARRPFDLPRDLLIRAKLFRLGSTEHVLVLTVHHIVFDLWSLGVLYRELAEAYGAYAEGHLPQLENLPIQYPDFAVWEQRWMQGEVLESLSSYWKTALGGGTDVQHLMLDRPRPTRPSYRGSLVAARVPPDVAASLLRLSQRQSVTPFMTLMAAFQTMLHRYSGHEDISVGFPIAHRTRAEVSDLIGFFVNTLVLKCNYSGNPTFTDVLRRVREASLAAYLHQDLPLEKLVRLLRPNRNAKQTLLFQSMFVSKDVPIPNLNWRGLEVTRFELNTGKAKFDVTMLVETKPDLKVTLEYNRDLFDAATANRMLGHYLTLLAAVASNPDTPISNLAFLSAPERAQLLVEWNDTVRPIPPSTVQELFEKQAESNPESVAVVFEDQQLTYRKLNQRANALACRLMDMGVKPEVKVGICAERSLDLIIGLLAILKAGGAYVPIDPAYPQERTRFIIQDADIRVLLTQTGVAHHLPAAGVATICLDTFPYTSAGSRKNPASGAKPDTLAYVIYTSGSTGRPKGVEVLHQGIVRLLFGQDYVPLDRSQVVLHASSITFDLSTFEIWAPLLHGGRLVLFPGTIPLARDLGKVIKKHQVTMTWLTSTLFNAVIDDAPQALAPLRRILVGGEALSVPHVCRANRVLPGVEIINGYGPTEATTFATTYRIPKEAHPGVGSIPIGKPITNTQVYVLDPHMQPVPIGVPGELCIGGPGVARGYLNRPELTAAKFVPNPFSKIPGDKLYKTGDRVRWLPCGELEFLGRLDNQVKIRGFRVELGEIESALARHPDIKSVAVVTRDLPTRGRQIVAYPVLRNGHKPLNGDLQSFLRASLPEYMVPSDYVFLDALPTSPSGKVDRLALPAPEEADPQAAEELLGPRDQVESELVKIWEGLLGKKPISIRANFYDLGGHSLLAVRVIAAIESTVGKKLPLSTLISAPTIEKLAVSLRDEDGSNSSTLVAIQAHGAKPPLFCVHGGGGEVTRFLPLARQLGLDQPLYGLRSPELDGNPTLVSVEFLAQKYLQELRNLKPEGPYYIAGASFGGLVAFEMARQLEEQGAEVALLTLFDTGNPAFQRSLPFLTSLKFGLWHFGAKCKDHWERFARAKPRQRPQVLLQTLGAVKARVDFLFWGLSCQYFNWRERPLPVRLRDNLKLFTAVGLRFRPKPYAGRITLFKAAEEGAEFGPDPDLGWGSIAHGGVEVYEVPGDHMTILDEPRVAKLAEQLRLCLKAAQEKFAYMGREMLPS